MAGLHAIQGKNNFTRCLLDSAVAKFKEAIPSALNSLTPKYNRELVS